MDGYSLEGKEAIEVTISVMNQPTIHPNTERPSWCFVKIPGEDKVTVVKDGENGHRGFPLVGFDVVEANEMIGVSKGQTEAMLAGSMFGWHVPAAQVSTWNEDGTLKRETTEGEEE